jgi:hypothetical protein
VKRGSDVHAIVAGIAAGGSALASSWVLRHTDFDTALRLFVALIPVPLFLWFIIAELRLVRRFDEFQRRVVLEALAIAFPAAIMVAVTVESLQKGGFVTSWTVGDVWPFMALVWLPALYYTHRRYQRGG